MSNTAPVVKEHSAEAQKATSAAISSTVTKRPRGIFDSMKSICCLRHLVEDRGLGGRRRDAIDRDVVARELLAERFGQRDDAGLGGRIGGRVRIALLAGDRGDIDDAAVVLRDHQRHDRAAAIELAVEIDAHHLRPGLRSDIPRSSRWGRRCRRC